MTKWTEITMSDKTTWDREKPLEGKYIKFDANVGPNESIIYTIQTLDGEVGVWGSTVLDTKMAEVQPGSEVRIEPLGMVKSEKSGREYMDFKVLFKPVEFEEAGYAKAKATVEAIRGKAVSAEQVSDEDEEIDLNEIPY